MNEASANLRYVPPSGAGIAFSLEEDSILERVNRKVAAAASLDELLEFLLTATAPISPCDRIAVAFVDESRHRLVSHGVRARYAPLRLKEGFAQDLAGSSLQAVIEEGTPRIIDDLEAYLAAHPASVSTRLLVEEGVRSSLTCPLSVDNRRVGVLFRSSRRAGAYDERQVRLHEAVAERLAQAVEKAYRIEQLAASNRAYLELLGFVSHEIKGPLAGMLLEGHILTDGYVGELTPPQKERVLRIIRTGEYLAGLTREYLDLARIEGGTLELRSRDDVRFATGILDPALELAGAAVRQADMRVTRDVQPPDLKLACDPNLMLVVLANLIENAAKYGRPGGEIRVQARGVGTAVVVTVWNEGVGFTDADRSRLFRKFSRLDRPEFARIKGTGVGLYSAWRIVALHRGRIQADSKFGEWAEFRVELPQVAAAGVVTVDPRSVESA